MPQPTQATRHIAIDTPLGDDVLLLRSFSGHEEISRLFEFDLDLLSEDYEINFDDIIGQNVTIRMELPEGGTALLERITSIVLCKAFQPASSLPSTGQRWCPGCGF